MNYWNHWPELQYYKKIDYEKLHFITFLFGSSSLQKHGKIQSDDCQSYYDKKLKIKIFNIQ